MAIRQTNLVKGDGEDAAIYSIAMEQAHFRSYNEYIVLAVCGLGIYSISGAGSSSLQNRHVITCNFALNYDQQMRINVYNIIGLISGGLLIAIPSDLTSRLKPLVLSLVFYGLATWGRQFCTEYYCFLILSVFGAFWTSALLAVTTVYVAELQPPRSRGLSLCSLQIFRLLGLVAMPVWSISWKTSQFISGVLALIAAGLAYFLTESPRLLLTLGKTEAAIESLKTIYRRNIRNREAEYPVKILHDDPSSGAQSYIKLRTYIPKALRPPWYSFLVVMQIQFFSNLCYFTMSYWFRQIDYRPVLIFRSKMSESFDCKLGEKYSPALRKKNESGALSDSSSCTSYFDADYHIEVLIVAAVTLPILVWMILRIDHFGRSYYTTLSHVIAGLLSFWVHFFIATKYAVIYTSLMESMWIVSWTVSTCLVTEIFKTRYRVFGVALANGFGYVGMAMGLCGVLLRDGSSCIFVMSLTGILITGITFFHIGMPRLVKTVRIKNTFTSLHRNK